MFDRQLWPLFPRTLKKMSTFSLALACHLSVLAENIDTVPIWQTASLPDVSEGAFMNVRLLASGSSDNLRYELIEGPAWVKVSGLGVMTYRPDYLAAGSHQVAARVSDGEHQVDKSWNILVRDINQQPELHNSPVSTVNEGEIFRFDPEITDIDKDSLTLNLAASPEGMKLVNGEIIWQVDYASAGNYTYQLLISDGNVVVKHAFDLSVKNINQKPHWRGFTLKTGKENQLFQQSVQAYDLDADQLSYTLIKAPDGAVIQGGVIEWLPDFETAGKHDIQIAASDGIETTLFSGMLIVDNTNRLPEITAEVLVDAKEGDAYSYQFVAKDPDGEALAFSINKAIDGLSLSKDGLLNWQPDFNAAGQYKLDLSVSDDVGHVIQPFTLLVENTNRPPLFQSLKLAGGTESEAYQSSIEVSDPDEDSVSLTMLSGPDGLELNNNILAWLPSYDDAGEHPVVIEASDGDLTTRQTFHLQVENTNRLPAFTSEPVVVANENTLYQYLLTYLDEDKDALQVSLTQAPKTMRLDNNTLVWMPSFNDAGSVDVEVKVSEKLNPKAFVIQRFVIDVANINRPPVWQTKTLPQAKENSALQVQLKARDPDDQRISYSIDAAPEGFMLSDSGLIDWTPHFEQSGSYDVTLIADDGEDKVAHTLSIYAVNTNRPPVITSEASVEADENRAYTYQIMAEDPDADQLTVKLLISPKGFEVEGSSLYWLPGYHQAGKHKVIVEVSDGELVAKQSFMLDVQNTNREPVWRLPEHAELDLLEYKVWSLSLSATDADKQAVSYKLLTSESGLRLNGNILQWKPSFEQAGSYLIALEASDGESVVEQVIELDVVNVNRSPRITSKAIKKGKEGVSYRYDLSAQDPDKNDQDNLSYRLLKAPDGMIILDQTISWIPSFDAAGVHQVIIEVSDEETSTEQSFDVRVVNTNRPPMFASEPMLAIDESVDYQYPVHIEDPDGQPVSLKLINAPKGARLVNETLIYSPDFKDAGVYSVVLSATDGQLITEQRFELTVNNVNRAPVITTKPSLNAYEGVGYRYKYNATDKDGEATAFSLVDSPKGMRLVAGQIQWRPSYTQKGLHAVKIAVTDGQSAVYQAFNVQVKNTNREPDFVKLDDQKIRVAKKWQLPLIAKDVDGEPVTFRLIHAPEGMSITEDNALYWKPKKDALGTHTVIVSVTDGDLKVRQHFDVKVFK